MTTFLFWNLNKKPLQDIIANLARRHEIDVLIFAECAIPVTTLLEALNPRETSSYHYSPKVLCEKIEIYTRFHSSLFPPVYETDRLTIRHLLLPGLTNILVAAIHFPSKNHWSEDDQASETTKVIRDIINTEQVVGHAKTIFVGDLNMNPFEKGMVGAANFHAVMSRAVAKGKTRIVQGEQYTYFYNPMWNFLGDHSPGAPGSYYLRGSGHIVFFWHMFDQVLVRPDLLDLFHTETVRILDTDGSVSFLSRDGTPNQKLIGDHLPLLFSVDL
jgi:hypothetical protein